MSYSIIIGLGFGDEGKGVTTSYLCKQSTDNIVVRFNGGHQAGHTVVHNGIRHVFSSWGSGTLQNVPTYWSHFCTFYPIAFKNERDELLKKIKRLPKFYIHPLAPVTTPYDVLENRHQAEESGHGSVGVGFGTTLKRQEDYYKLHVQDIFYESVLRQKLKAIRSYYGYHERLDESLGIEEFITTCKEVSEQIVLHDESVLELFSHVIFEGAQGVLLDQDFGFFPNVTRSNTTSKNAVKIIKKLKGTNWDTWYVTRTYQTRHGNGFMTNEDVSISLKNNEDETNVKHKFQGDFRIAPIDYELLKYALSCDKNSWTGGYSNEHLMITCADQHPNPFTIKDNCIKELNFKSFSDIIISESQEGPKNK